MIQTSKYINKIISFIFTFSEIFNWNFTLDNKPYSIFLKDNYSEKNFIYISKDNTNWKKIDILDKEYFYYNFTIDKYYFNIRASQNKKYSLFIDSFCFEDINQKNENINNINNINNNANDKNDNKEELVDEGLEKNLIENIKRMKINNEKYKSKSSRNVKSNLEYQSSDELFKKAVNNEKKKLHLTLKDTYNNNKFKSVLPETAKHLPKSIYHVYQFNNKNMDKECRICLQNFVIGQEILTLPCFHFFHCNCISDWLRKKEECPICKSSIIVDIPPL